MLPNACPLIPQISSPFLFYDNLQDHMFLNFGQELSLQVESQQADMMVQVLDAVLPTEDT